MNSCFGILRGYMNKKIWTPFKIWNETQWFTNFEKIIKKFKKKRIKE